MWEKIEMKIIQNKLLENGAKQLRDLFYVKMKEFKYPRIKEISGFGCAIGDLYEGFESIKSLFDEFQTVSPSDFDKMSDILVDLITELYHHINWHIHDSEEPLLNLIKFTLGEDERLLENCNNYKNQLNSKRMLHDEAIQFSKVFSTKLVELGYNNNDEIKSIEEAMEVFYIGFTKIYKVLLPQLQYIQATEFYKLGEIFVNIKRELSHIDWHIHDCEEALLNVCNFVSK